jgi:hypothetical protein
MIELVLLIAAITTVAGIARGRGATPWQWGTVATVGYLAVGFAVFYALESRLTTVTSPVIARIPWPGIAGWGWIGCVVVYLRFFRGRAAVQPEGKWTCPSCTWLNARYSIVCEACKEPYRQP